MVKSGIRALDWREPARVPIEPGMTEWKLYVRLFDEIDREFGGRPTRPSTAFLRITRDDGRQAIVLAGRSGGGALTAPAQRARLQPQAPLAGARPAGRASVPASWAWRTAPSASRKRRSMAPTDGAQPIRVVADARKRRPSGSSW